MPIFYQILFSSFIVSKNILKYLFIIIDFYLVIWGANDIFFDIVFDLKMDYESYNFIDNEYIDKTPKIIWTCIFSCINVSIFLCCIYTMIYIVAPSIYFRLWKVSKKNLRISELQERLLSRNITLIKDRNTSQA